MTKVIGINCHKWLRIIEITLWAGFTMGIIYAGYYSYYNTVNGDAQKCAYESTNYGAKGFGDFYKLCLQYSKWDPIILYLVIAVNIGNLFSMWLVINYKYKFVELRCTS